MRENDEFLQHRAARQKKMRKKRIKRTIIFFAFLCVAVAIILCLTVFFPIKNVSATGSKIYSEAQIVKAASLEGKNLFTVSEEKLEEKIRKKLPFTENVTVKRSLPDRITIKVKDALEYSYYVNGGKFYTASESGYILKEYTTEPQGLLKIVCGKIKTNVGEKIELKSEKESEIIESLLSKLKEKKISVNGIDVSSTVAIRATVEGRFDVIFGTSSYLEKKISHLKGMINSIEEGRKGVIDLSMWTPEKSEGSFTEIK